MENPSQRLNFNSLIKQIKTLPQPKKTEESILLRVLVQIMVIIGIIATDVAAQIIFPMSFWAVPLSIIGAVVSWYRRKKRNITLKFTLAVGMLIALVSFLGNLLISINDTRLVLAELLIQLQVLHSFDLPRRKDLGYSMVIGLILMGVSATLSQTLAFAPWLLLLLIIAIPTLILDYRSRIGLDTWDKQWGQVSKVKEKNRQSIQWQNSSLSPKKIFSSISIIMVLGLFIFAIMPRYTGYQFQSFPVNAPNSYQNQNFPQGDKSVVNPGYNPDGTPRENLLGEGQENNGNGTGKSKDNTSYYGFNTKINQNFNSGNSGSLKKKLLFRIRSQYPGFWRVLAFDHYIGQGWEIQREEQTTKTKKHPWNYRFNLSSPSIQGETKKVIQTYTTVADLPNIIPSLRYAESLFFPSREIALDSEGGLRAPAGLIEGLTYTVISRVPYRNQEELQQAGDNYSYIINKYYLDVPSEIKAKIKVKTEELISKSNRELKSNYDIALYLAQAIKQNYSVPEDFSEFPQLKEGEDLAEAFLYKRQGGNPDHFATVYTLMLRSIGIPARLVVGFNTGQFNPFTGYYLVHNTDAYAMTEVYFPNFGWFYFDPLPGHEIIPPSFQDDNAFGVLGLLWKWVAGWLPPPLTDFIGSIFTQITETILSIFQTGWLSKLWQFITGSFVGVLVGVLGVIIFTFLGWLTLNFLQKLAYVRYLNKLHPMAKLYREMVDFLSDKGHDKNTAQTPYEYAQSLNNVLMKEQLDIIHLISHSYVQWRYGNVDTNIYYLRSQFKLLQNSLHKTSLNYQLLINTKR